METILSFVADLLAFLGEGKAAVIVAKVRDFLEKLF